MLYDIGPEELRENERQAAGIVEDAYERGIIDDRERVTIGENNRVGNVGDAFNAVNHMLLSAKHHRLDKRAFLQGKEALQHIFQDAQASEIDWRNNRVGFEIGQRSGGDMNKIKEGILQALKEGRDTKSIAHESFGERARRLVFSEGGEARSLIDKLRKRLFERLKIKGQNKVSARRFLNLFNEAIVLSESTNNWKAENKETTASGGYQFTDDTVKSAANNTLYGLAVSENFKPDLSRKDQQSERLLAYKKERNPPKWLIDASEGKYRGLDLTPEQQQVLFEGHMFERKGSDRYIKRILKGDQKAMTNYYYDLHHTDPKSQPNTKENWELGLNTTFKAYEVMSPKRIMTKATQPIF